MKLFFRKSERADRPKEPDIRIVDLRYISQVEKYFAGSICNLMKVRSLKCLATNSSILDASGISCSSSSVPAVTSSDALVVSWGNRYANCLIAYTDDSLPSYESTTLSGNVNCSGTITTGHSACLSVSLRYVFGSLVPMFS